MEPYCPLLTAVEKDSIEIVQYLLEQKANPNIVSKVYKYTPSIPSIRPCLSRLSSLRLRSVLHPSYIILIFVISGNNTSCCSMQEFKFCNGLYAGGTRRASRQESRIERTNSSGSCLFFSLEYNLQIRPSLYYHPKEEKGSG